VLEIDDAARARSPEVDLFRAQRREDGQLAPCARNGDIQATMTAHAVQRGNLRRNASGLVWAHRDRKDDHVTLVTLHVLDVLDEDGFASPHRQRQLEVDRSNVMDRLVGESIDTPEAGSQKGRLRSNPDLNLAKIPAQEVFGRQLSSVRHSNPRA
jgi:hypothetical protein